MWSDNASRLLALPFCVAITTISFNVYKKDTTRDDTMSHTLTTQGHRAQVDEF